MTLAEHQQAISVAILDAYDGLSGPDPEVACEVDSEHVPAILAWLGSLGFMAYEAGSGVSVAIWPQCPGPEAMAVLGTPRNERTPDMLPLRLVP